MAAHARTLVVIDGAVEATIPAEVSLWKFVCVWIDDRLRQLCIDPRLLRSGVREVVCCNRGIIPPLNADGNEILPFVRASNFSVVLICAEDPAIRRALVTNHEVHLN